MAATKRTRFEVLKRDNHTCRYCGVSAPDAVLTVDHVVPVSLGGSDDPSNLVAACKDCNSGKSSTSPSASTVAQVSEDALRWRKAMELANEMAQSERQSAQVQIDAFRDRWSEWGYPGRNGGREMFPLPGGWEYRVKELFAAGLSIDDIGEAIDLAIGNKYVKDEFYYMIGVCRQKIAQRQAVAQALIARGDV